MDRLQNSLTKTKVGKAVRKKVPRILWVEISCAILFVLCLMFMIVLAWSLIAQASDNDWSAVSLFCVLGMSLCVLGCLAILQIPTGSIEAHGDQPKLMLDDEEPEDKLRTVIDLTTIPADKSTSKSDDDLLRAVAHDECSGSQSHPTVKCEPPLAPVESSVPIKVMEPERAPSATAVSFPTSKGEPASELAESAVPIRTPERDVSASAAAAISYEDLSSKLTPTIQMQPKKEPQLGASKSVLSDRPQKIESVPQQHVKETTRLAQCAPTNSSVRAEPDHHTSPKSAQLSEATERETAEVKSMLDCNLDATEEDLLRQVVAVNVETEDLENSILAEVDEQPEDHATASASGAAKSSGAAETRAALLSQLDDAVLTADRSLIQKALSAALAAKVDETLPQILDAKAALAESDKLAAANAELDAAQRAGELDRLQNAIKKAREAGINPVCLEAAIKLTETLEAQAEALVLLSSAILSNDTHRLREALTVASDCGLTSTHTQVAEAQKTLAALDVVQAAATELSNAISNEADVKRLRNRIDIARNTGVEERLLSVAEDKVKRIEAQEDARAKLDVAIANRMIQELRNALDVASKAGLRGDAPRVVRATAALKEVEVLQELESATRAADISRLKKALASGRAAGVAVDVIAAGEAKVRELENRKLAAEKLTHAIAARDADLLRAAIAQASAAGLSAADVHFAKASQILTEVEASAAALKELEAAIEFSDAQRLKNAIDAARGCAVAADRIAAAEKSLGIVLAKASAEKSLSAAIAAKDIDALRAALEEAASAGLSKSHEQVTAAQSALAEADALAAACAELESARKAGDIDRLRQAIEVGQSVGIDTKLAETALDKLQAQALAKAEAASELEAAVACVSESPERLRSAIQAAKDLDAVPDATMKAAAAALDLEEKRRALQKDLEAASASRNIELIKATLDIAYSANLPPCTQLEVAEKILREETLKEEARLELLHIIGLQEIDVEQLRLALETASTRGIAPEEDVVANAKEVLAREEAKRSILAELESGTQDAEQIDSQDPFGLEKARDQLVDGVARARELGLTDTNPVVQRASMMRRKLHNTLQDLIGATRVFCRVRPTNSREKKLDSPVVVNVVGGMSVEVTDEDGDHHKFEFDAAFSPTSTQEQIFAECKDLVQSVLDGYNITIFAYGQTGAGKTFTMMGCDDPPELKGVCPRTIEALFEAIERESERYDITVTAFMVEVYCSKINDLGDDDDDSSNLSKNQRRDRRRTRGGPRRMRDKGIKVRCIDDKVMMEGVCERPIDDTEDLFDLLEDGNSQKKVTATAMNAGSSRSHTILGINVMLTNKDTKKQHRGKILLVDLAGSERLKKSEVTGAARKEAIEINKSLTALGDVISAITLGKRVPYRNHVLTMLMSDSLGGTAKTLMFVNASPALDNADETVMALNFATRAKTITSREAAVVALQAARRGIIDRRKTRELKAS